MTRCPRCNGSAIKEGADGWCINCGSFELRRVAPLDVPLVEMRKDGTPKRARVASIGGVRL